MTELERIEKAIKHLIYIGFAENETELSQKLGYNNTYVSQIKNGKTPITGKFIKNLCNADPNLNNIWIIEGSGEMLKAEQKSVTKEESYKDRYISLLEDRVEEQKKTIERQGKCIEMLKELGSEPAQTGSG